MKGISQVCTIQTGFTARGRLEPTEHGLVLALQLRDIASDASIAWESVIRIQLDDVPERYFVRAGDVVFRSRGERNTAAVVDQSLPGPTLAVLPLMILRPDTQLVSSAYLAWAINQAEAQRQFEEEAQGTSLRMVSRSSLEKLQIPVPDFQTQQKILEIDALVQHEHALTLQLATKRHELMHHILIERAGQSNLVHRMEKKPK